MLEDHKALLRRFVAIWESGDVHAPDQIVDVNYVGHVATGDRDRDGLIDRILAFRAAMPNAVFTVEAQIAEGVLVATRLTADRPRHPRRDRPAHPPHGP